MDYTPTTRQVEIALTIRAYRARNHKCPTVSELAQELSRSKATVHGRLKKMRQLGMLTKVEPHVSRQTRLSQSFATWLRKRKGNADPLRIAWNFATEESRSELLREVVHVS